MRRILMTLLIATAALVALPIAASAGGGCHKSEQTEASGTDIDFEGFCVTPNVLHTQAGDTVTWTNRDSADHTVTAGANEWENQDLGQNDTFQYTFEEPGAYAWYCMLHAGMGGTVLVAAADAAAADAPATPEAEAADAVAAPAVADTSSGYPLGIALGAFAVLLAGSAGFVIGRRTRGVQDLQRS